MTEFFDALETRSPEARAAAEAERLPRIVAGALAAPGWRAHLGEIDPAAIRDRAALAGLKVLRKSDLPGLQKASPPFGASRASSPRPVRFSRARAKAQIPGGPRGRCTPQACARATSSSTPSVIT